MTKWEALGMELLSPRYGRSAATENSLEHLEKKGCGLTKAEVHRPAHSVSHALTASDCRVFPSPTSSAIKIPGRARLGRRPQDRRRAVYAHLQGWLLRRGRVIFLIAVVKGQSVDNNIEGLVKTSVVVNLV